MNFILFLIDMNRFLKQPLSLIYTEVTGVLGGIYGANRNIYKNDSEKTIGSVVTWTILGPLIPVRYIAHKYRIAKKVIDVELEFEWSSNLIKKNDFFLHEYQQIIMNISKEDLIFLQNATKTLKTISDKLAHSLNNQESKSMQHIVIIAEANQAYLSTNNLYKHLLCATGKTASKNTHDNKVTSPVASSNNTDN